MFSQRDRQALRRLIPKNTDAVIVELWEAAQTYPRELRSNSDLTVSHRDVREAAKQAVKSLDQARADWIALMRAYGFEPGTIPVIGGEPTTWWNDSLRYLDEMTATAAFPIRTAPRRGAPRNDARFFLFVDVVEAASRGGVRLSPTPGTPLNQIIDIVLRVAGDKSESNDRRPLLREAIDNVEALRDRYQ
jgi:hypothetical protein